MTDTGEDKRIEEAVDMIEFIVMNGTGKMLRSCDKPAVRVQLRKYGQEQYERAIRECAEIVAKESEAWHSTKHFIKQTPEETVANRERHEAVVDGCENISFKIMSLLPPAPATPVNGLDGDICNCDLKGGKGLPITPVVDASPSGGAKCPNCEETVEPCACVRNICTGCGEPVGNITFTLCDMCWEKKHIKPATPQKEDGK